MNNKDKAMLPVSREEVEVDGVYTNEWGREEVLHRGQDFPSDPMLGTTEWQLSEFIYDNHHDGRTDPRLVPKENDTDKIGKITHPRKQHQGGDAS
ncbi:transposase [Paenibacillus chibensis]|uniref:Transposase n=1 Tax=Paenibacillus chibensis TaxID=59846 RepID=A0ABU6PPX3_9BACL|nr:transposase [Paenibacillus chibensis]MEC0373391.1 transposase [Paenibacillus chibensis]MED5016211.1 transposase [Paenibacillus chibensis]